MIETTSRSKERAFLVGVEIASMHNLLTLEDSLNELTLLANTAGIEVVGQTTQKLHSPHPKTFIGSGKLEEINMLIEENEANLLLFDEELSPRHQRELENIFGLKVRVLDRTALILDIFSQHAHTREGALQVELAQYEYRLPRLTRAWTHLARQAGGGGGRSGSVGGVGLRGPGEKQLEVDRREIHRRIDHLKRDLENVRSHRLQHRRKRQQTGLAVVALVGYTNAGKSTLLNCLSGAEVYVADHLFATLDPTTRKINLPDKRKALLTDTVGFIQKLPTTLVAAFRATLEEVSEADLLLHIIDISHPNAIAHSLAVFQTLSEIGAKHIPVLTVLNKVDLLQNTEQARNSLESFENAVAISALTHIGIDDLLAAVNRILYEDNYTVKLTLPYSEGNLISMIHNFGVVENIEYKNKFVIITAKIPGRFLARYHNYINE